MSQVKYQVTFTQDQHADMGFDMTSRMSSLLLLKNRSLQIVNTRRHLRIMGARRVTWSKVHSEDTNIMRHRAKFSRLVDLEPEICAPLVTKDFRF